MESQYASCEIQTSEAPGGRVTLERKKKKGEVEEWRLQPGSQKLLLTKKFYSLV